MKSDFAIFKSIVIGYCPNATFVDYCPNAFVYCERPSVSAIETKFPDIVHIVRQRNLKTQLYIYG